MGWMKSGFILTWHPNTEFKFSIGVWWMKIRPMAKQWKMAGVWKPNGKRDRDGIFHSASSAQSTHESIRCEKMPTTLPEWNYILSFSVFFEWITTFYFSLLTFSIEHCWAHQSSVSVCVCMPNNRTWHLPFRCVQCTHAWAKCCSQIKIYMFDWRMFPTILLNSKNELNGTPDESEIEGVVRWHGGSMSHTKTQT